MCGIIGYLGKTDKRDISSILISGLERLSYRGYDSSGLAIIDPNNELLICKKEGKLGNLKKTISGLNLKGRLGIAHTRWATHGIPSDANAHPLLVGEQKKTAIVHNGIIENHYQIKKALQKRGRVFHSETDSEVVAHLMDEQLLKGASLLDAMIAATKQLEGSYALVAISESQSNVMVAACKGSPLLVTDQKGESIVASDQNALVLHGSSFFPLLDDEFLQISDEGVFTCDLDKNRIDKTPTRFETTREMGERGEHDHFMIKEIKEQPLVLRRIHDAYIKGLEIDFPKIDPKMLKNVSRFVIQACGTSWHSGMVAKYWIEKYARIWTEVDISSEFRYRNRPMHKDEMMVIALSQSGETADTLACVMEAKSNYTKVLSFVNVAGSSIDRNSDGTIYSHAGIEIGVASTKNYLAQLYTLYLFSLYMAKLQNHLSDEDYQRKILALEGVPDAIEKILKCEAKVIDIAKKYATQNKGFIFIGRNYNYPTALEGALKLKEVSYINATGYPAGELKHGPIALIEELMPTVCIVPKSTDKGLTYSKMLSNIQEVKSRKGKLIAIATEGDDLIASLCDEVLYIPEVDEELSPLLSVVPLQLLAYHMAILLDCDVDQPKNLAKSVTVE